MMTDTLLLAVTNLATHFHARAGVVKAVCKGMRGVTLEAEHTAVPGRPSDGGYWARLRKGL